MDGQTITIIGAFIAMLVGMWSIVSGFRKEVATALRESNEDLAKTTQLLFKRFDDHKDATDRKIIYSQEIYDKKYAQSSVCEITRANFSKLFDDINRKLDLLLEERRNATA